MDNKEETFMADEKATVPLAYHEMCMTRNHKTVLRLLVCWAVSVVLIVCAFVWLWCQYDYVSTVDNTGLMGDTGYSQASAPIMSAKLEVSSDFLRAVKGKEESAWDIIDDLMDTLKVAYPRVYDSVMRRIGNL